LHPFVNTIKEHLGSDVVNMKSPGAKNRGYFYNGKRQARRFSADVVTQNMRPWSSISVLRCAITPERKLIIIKLFHVFLCRIVCYRICVWLGTQIGRRTPDSHCIVCGGNCCALTACTVTSR
jgi:hypothetical protein